MRNFCFYLVTLLISNTTYAQSEINFDTLPACPNPNWSSEYEKSMALPVGHSCWVWSRPTKNYRDKVKLRWTLVQKNDRGRIWSVDTKWGRLFVGDIEKIKKKKRKHGAWKGTKEIVYWKNIFGPLQAEKEVCHRTEKVWVPDGEQLVTMILPRMGFNHEGDKENPMNVEALFHMRYESVVIDDGSLYWSSSPQTTAYGFKWTFSIKDGEIYKQQAPGYHDRRVRCMGYSKLARDNSCFFNYWERPECYENSHLPDAPLYGLVPTWVLRYLLKWDFAK